MFALIKRKEIESEDDDFYIRLYELMARVFTYLSDNNIRSNHLQVQAKNCFSSEAVLILRIWIYNRRGHASGKYAAKVQ